MEHFPGDKIDYVTPVYTERRNGFFLYRNSEAHYKSLQCIGVYIFLLCALIYWHVHSFRPGHRL